MPFIIGACIGSFLCCQVRRLRLRELHKKPLGSRSVCMYCHYRLKWYDNLPIISWLALGGKCRRCHHKIGLAELLSELGTGLALAAISTTIDWTTATPLTWANFIIILLFTFTLIFLAIYDGLYGELPTICLIVAIVFAVIALVLKELALLSAAHFTPELIWRPLLSVVILGGIYLVLYLVSHGKWVGDGDWLLGTAIALVLYDPWLSLIALFLANFIACLVMYPAIKSRKNHHIHFGPFLVIAFVITYTFTNFFLTML